MNGSIFSSIEIGETEETNCLPNYYVFQNVSPYLPIQDAKGEAICLLNDDNVTASWNIIQLCEPSCSLRGGCDNNQTCAKPVGETIDRCFCAGYLGKYCDTIDAAGFLSFFFLSFFDFLLSYILIGCDQLNCTNNGVCIDTTGATAAYCNCIGTGYDGNFCENDINECLTNNGGCDSNAICTNEIGSFNCKCKNGYSGDGFICIGIFFWLKF